MKTENILGNKESKLSKKKQKKIKWNFKKTKKI